ncbi:hypothetical protein BHM03_00027761 [Ensete ventricosum]|nr:hypothetical protein BHM03_00027761 [Ensete ventricosum]
MTPRVTSVVIGLTCLGCLVVEVAVHIVLGLTGRDDVATYVALDLSSRGRSSCSIGEASDLKYDAQSNRRGPRSGVSGLSGYRRSHRRSPQADVSRLTDQDDVALGLSSRGRSYRSV